MILHLLLFLVLYVLTKHFFNKIRNLPPSPFPALPIIGHLHLLRKPLHRSLSAISNRYGPVLILQFGYRHVLLVSSPSAAEECFTKNDVVFANRPRLLHGKHIGYNYTSLAWAPYGDLWRNLRKLSSLEILSSHRLQLLSSIRSDEVKLLIRRLFNNKDEKLDLKSAFFELMLNVMMRMIAGKRYYGENVEEVEKAASFQKIVRETFLFAGTSNMGDFLPLLAKIGGVEKRLLDLQKRRDGFIQVLIEEHRKRMSTSPSEEKNKTLIEVLLTLQQSDPDCYTDQTIKSLMLLLLAAGTDTSAVTMEWAMSLLVNNPEILKKAQSEIDNVVGQDHLMNESDALKIPYLHCIISEVMRMYPAGPLLVPHESSEECSIGGYRVPPGTMLLVNMWSIQNDPRVWEEPKKFKPERFEGCEAGVRDGFRLMPFGSGRRSCPGEGLALRMVGLTLGSVLQCFEWERVGKEMVDMTEGVGLTMPKAQPLIVKCRPRPSMVNLLSQV
ncbi:cytochrome P450 81Q32 [Hevea brasiliensis]|uniref:cytochrome P450 81Q32 n=1 Tax=Hevea brasiliensis TaxID=3981 RepID=UPI0025D145FC|nr:cytochrome P450 81Q32 [Hevea brasiliensis]